MLITALGMVRDKGVLLISFNRKVSQEFGWSKEEERA